MRHLVSFLRSPIGYMLNGLATLLVVCERAPWAERAAMWAGDALSNACEVFCLRDGVQDEPWF